MATVLDIGILQNFSAVFTFLLVFAATFAVLNFTHLFGDKGGSPGIYGIIAFCLAILTLFFPVATKLVSNMAPWFVILFFFIIFLLIAYKLFGVSDADLTETIKSQPGIKWAIFIAGFLIFIMALSSAYGPGLLGTSSTVNATASSATAASAASGDFGSNVRATFFNEKVLGMIFILLVACAAIGMLGSKAKG